MKKEMSKKFYKLFPLLLSFVLALPSLSQAQSSSFEKEISINQGTTLAVGHSYGKILVKKASGNTIKAKVVYEIKGKSDADAKRLIDKIKFREGQNGQVKTLSVVPPISSYRKSTFATEITFEDGDMVKGISEIKIDLELAIPDGIELKLKNQYDDISIGARKGKISVELFEGDLMAKGVTGTFDLSLKYGSANLGSLRELNAELFESKLELESADQLNLDSKYSKHFIKKLNNPTIMSFEGKFTIDEITGTLALMDKYSTWTIGKLEKGSYELFETKMNMTQVGQLRVDSKYGKFEVGSAESLNFEISFEDDIEVNTLGNFRSANSKYGDFDISSLSGSIVLAADFESDLSVSKVATNWQGLTIDGKYTDINLGIPTAAQYQLDFESSYGKLKFPKKSFTNLSFSDKNDQIKAKGSMPGAGDTLVTIRGYEVSANLNK